MGGTGLVLSGLFISVLLIYQVSTQELKECKKNGDYLWKKSTPNKFYFCYRVGYAMAMECLDNKYMCKVPGKVFAPCMCEKGDKVNYDDCEEKFRLVPAMNRTGGQLIKTARTDAQCSKQCLNTVHCQAYTFTSTTSLCRIFLPKNQLPSLETSTGVNYFVKKACALKFGYKHRELKSGDTTRPSGGTTAIPSSTDTAPPPRGSKDNDLIEGKEGDEEHTSYGKHDYSDVTPQTPRATTTTIPDSGCPFGLEKFENTSHRGGVLLKYIEDMESCKSWCLNVGYCRGVDYDELLSYCYWHRVIDDEALSIAQGVWHVRKLHCQPPLKCWSQISYNSSNVDPSTPQIPCQGVCFVREKIFNNYSVFERGCHASNPPHRVGCEVDGALMGLTCFCDTDRCNGLSIAALASVMLHLPLDDDGRDHSGLGRDGQSALGYQMPEVTCLEKAINCSMMFNGEQCIEVTQLAAAAWGEVNLQNDFTSMFTVSVWFKSLGAESENIQGITGNSWDPEVAATWAIQTSNITSNLVTAGITTQNDGPFKPDFPYIVAPPGEWHHLALTYDSTYSPEDNQFPLVRVFLDGVEAYGNMQSDYGAIRVRKQPVTVGCVMGRAFIGFIDDLRIFGSALTKEDIQALLQMNDGLYQ